MCTNKSNLLIALLRALKIPSGYGILKVETIKFYGPLMCPSFKYLVSPQTKHFYTGVFFDGKWIRCDPSVDSGLAESIRGKSIYGKLSGFGVTEKEFQSVPGVLKREEFLFTADKLLSRAPRRLTKSAQNLLNFYLLFLRENKNFIEKITSKEEIEKEFMNWLSKRNRQLFEYFKKIYKHMNFYSTFCFSAGILSFFAGLFVFLANKERKAKSILVLLESCYFYLDYFFRSYNVYLKWKFSIFVSKDSLCRNYFHSYLLC